MRFLGSKFTQNALVARDQPRTPLGELKRPQTPCRFQGAASRQGKGKGAERGRRKGEKKYWGRERGREGKREGGKGERGGKGRRGGVCVIGVRGDRRYWSNIHTDG